MIPCSPQLVTLLAVLGLVPGAVFSCDFSSLVVWADGNLDVAPGDPWGALMLASSTSWCFACSWMAFWGLTEILKALKSSRTYWVEQVRRLQDACRGPHFFDRSSKNPLPENPPNSFNNAHQCCTCLCTHYFFICTQLQGGKTMDKEYSVHRALDTPALDTPARAVKLCLQLVRWQRERRIRRRLQQPKHAMRRAMHGARIESEHRHACQ